MNWTRIGIGTPTYGTVVNACEQGSGYFRRFLLTTVIILIRSTGFLVLCCFVPKGGVLLLNK